MLEVAALIALYGTVGLIGIFQLMRKAKRMDGKYGGDTPLSANLYVAQALVSDTVKGLRSFKLNDAEFSNAKRLAVRIEKLVDMVGAPYHINSWGRPQRFADFVSALRAKGYHAVDNSLHNYFAAADIDYLDDKLALYRAYSLAQEMAFGEVIVTDKGKNQYLHVALPWSEVRK